MAVLKLLIRVERAMWKLDWCFDGSTCGEACNDVCAAAGLAPVDDATTFEAQNTLAECQVISDAFGITEPAAIASYTYACVEDRSGFHSTGDLNGGLLCSTFAGCPANHRTQMDQLGTACGANSRRSICACE